nr:transposase [Streptomyces tsukubensis NRRL18488]
MGGGPLRRREGPDRSQPMLPGAPERRTHNCLRHGITITFAVFNDADGTVISELCHQHGAGGVRENPDCDGQGRDRCRFAGRARPAPARKHERAAPRSPSSPRSRACADSDAPPDSRCPGTRGAAPCDTRAARVPRRGLISYLGRPGAVRHVRIKAGEPTGLTNIPGIVKHGRASNDSSETLGMPVRRVSTEALPLWPVLLPTNRPDESRTALGVPDIFDGVAGTAVLECRGGYERGGTAGSVRSQAA